MENTTKLVCMYHKNCADGFGAALVVKVWAKSQNRGVDFYPMDYGDLIPNPKGMDVIMVDFSLPRQDLIEIKKEASSLVVLDHHKTAEKELAGLDFCIFDMEKSGAMLTWDYLFPDKGVPKLIQYIQDRDLWNWKLKDSKAVSAALQGLDKDFDLWETYLNNQEFTKLVKRGKVILEYQNTLIKSVINKDVPLEYIAGYEVPCINATHLVSELGNAISKGFPFAAIYFDTQGYRTYELRSSEDGIDVSVIAEKFGGGGHFHSAGFKVSIPHINLSGLSKMQLRFKKVLGNKE